MKTRDAPVYAFYDPIPAIEELHGRQCHVFKCTTVGCKQKVRHFLDTNDKGSTSNLRSHSKRCWGEEAFIKVYEVKDVDQVQLALGKLKNSPNGNIAAIFLNLKGRGIVSYEGPTHYRQDTQCFGDQFCKYKLLPCYKVCAGCWHQVAQLLLPSHRLFYGLQVCDQ
jgi:hypothetical protein